MTNLCALLNKQFLASPSAVEGITAYSLESGSKKLYAAPPAAILRAKPKKKRTSLTRLVVKGDLPGHEFRGNQHTGGGELKIKESPEKKQRRINGGATKIITVDAAKFREVFESDNLEALPWKPARLERLRTITEPLDDHPDVGIWEVNGKLAVNDGRHRISLAAERGQTIKVAVRPKELKAVRAKLKQTKKFHYSQVVKGCGHRHGADLALLKAKTKMHPNKKYVLAHEVDVAEGIAVLFAKWRKKTLTAITKHLKPVVKGDLPGHEFRGNQWTGGLGGEVTSDTHDIFYHGTSSADKLKSIVADGLKTPEHLIGSARWFMVVDNEEAAASFGEHIVRIAIPKDETKNLLWRGSEAVYGKQHALKTGHIPAQYIATKKTIKPIGKADLRRLLKADDDASSIKRIIKAVLGEIDLDGLSTAFVSEISDSLMEAFKAGGISGLQVVGMEDSTKITELIPEHAVTYAKERAAELVGMKYDPETGKFITNPNPAFSITDVTREGIQNLTTEALEQGWSADDLKNKILDEHFFSKERAETIARTELAFAHTRGNLDAWEATGVVAGKQSILADTHPETDECDECADEGVIGIDEQFATGDDGPPYHPNCLCALVPILASEMTSTDESAPEKDSSPEEDSAGG